MLKHRLTLFSSLLLLSLSTVYAAPPSTPTLNVISQGLSVDAEWSSVDATGYRLFTSIDSGKVEMSDMGSMNRISAVMKHGTMVSVYVQAYNSDGDSPYSEMKTLVLNDPILGKTPDMLKPEAQALTFQSISLDTPVAFLPTDEDVEVQDRTVRNRSGQRTYGPEFDEGRISLTAHIAPTLIQRESLELSLCLGVADTCEPLLVWNSEAQEYTATITIRDLPNDVEKNVYLELLLPKALVEKLRTQPTEEQEYIVYATDVKSTNPAAQLVHVAKIPVINLGGQDARRSARGVSSLKINTPEFGKNFESGSFGVEFKVAPELWIYKTYATKGADKKAGAQLGATGNITATILGNTFSVMAVKGYATKNSGKRLTRKVTVNVLGLDIYTNWQSKKPKTSAAQVVKIKDTTPDSTNWQQCANNPTAQCSEPPATEAGEASSGDDGDEASPTKDNIFSYTKSVEKKKSKTYVIYIIPLTAELGVKGTAALNVGAEVEVTTNPIGLKVTGSSGPSADISGYASATVNFLIAEAGIIGTIELIKNTLNLNVVANLAISPFNLTFGGSVKDNIVGPNGNVSLFAKYLTVVWALPPWEWKVVTKTLVSWATFDKEFTLLSWGDDGSDQPQDPNAALAKVPATTNGDPIPIFTEEEPTSAVDPWVCVYATAIHNAPVMDANGVPLSCYDDGWNKPEHYITEPEQIKACTQIPVNPKKGARRYEELGFDIRNMDKASVSHKSKCPAGSPGARLAGNPIYDWMYDERWSSFENAVTAIIIRGPLRVGLFEGRNLTGSSAYWYAHSGVTESNYLGRAPANMMQKKSGSLLMTRIDRQSESPYHVAKPLKACFYKMDGISFCSSGDNENLAKELGAPAVVGNNGKDITNLGAIWNDQISSMILSGFGTVCVYAAHQFGEAQSCYPGYGIRYGLSFVSSRDSSISSIKFYPTPLVSLFNMMHGSLEEAGTSSLPNSYRLSAGGGDQGFNLYALGELSGFMSVDGTINQMYQRNTASVAAVHGPAIIQLMSRDDGRGTNSLFFLDEGEWDITFLNGFNDSTVNMRTWVYYQPITR